MRYILALAFLISAATSASAHGRGHGRDPCNSRELRQRTAAEVLESHRAALNAGDWEAVACNYAKDAVVIQDGAVTRGRDNIVADLQNISGLLGGVFPTVYDEVVVTILKDRAEMARVLFTLTTPCVDINDGADTYIIKDGKIEAQTAHGFPTFKCPPPGL